MCVRKCAARVPSTRRTIGLGLEENLQAVRRDHGARPQHSQQRIRRRLRKDGAVVGIQRHHRGAVAHKHNTAAGQHNTVQHSSGTLSVRALNHTRIVAMTYASVTAGVIRMPQLFLPSLVV